MWLKGRVFTGTHFHSNAVTPFFVCNDFDMSEPLDLDACEAKDFYCEEDFGLFLFGNSSSHSGGSHVIFESPECNVLRAGSTTAGLIFSAVGLNVITFALVLVEAISKKKQLQPVIYFLFALMAVFVLIGLANQITAILLYASDIHLNNSTLENGRGFAFGGLALLVVQPFWYWLACKVKAEKPKNGLLRNAVDVEPETEAQAVVEG